MIKGFYGNNCKSNLMTGTCQRCGGSCKPIAKYCLECRKIKYYELNRELRAKKKVSKK